MVVINGLAPPRVASIQWQSIEVVIDWLWVYGYMGIARILRLIRYMLNFDNRQDVSR